MEELTDAAEDHRNANHQVHNPAMGTQISSVMLPSEG